jgi:hypothetical protein
MLFSIVASVGRHHTTQNRLWISITSNIGGCLLNREHQNLSAECGRYRLPIHQHTGGSISSGASLFSHLSGEMAHMIQTIDEGQLQCLAIELTLLAGRWVWLYFPMITMYVSNLATFHGARAANNNSLSRQGTCQTARYPRPTFGTIWWCSLQFSKHPMLVPVHSTRPRVAG